MFLTTACESSCSVDANRVNTTTVWIGFTFVDVFAINTITLLQLTKTFLVIQIMVLHKNSKIKIQVMSVLHLGTWITVKSYFIDRCISTCLWFHETQINLNSNNKNFSCNEIPYENMHFQYWIAKYLHASEVASRLI